MIRRPRSRSFGSDPDDDSSGETTTPKGGWLRRDADSGRASSHRRFYSSSSKPYDERLPSSSSSKKRFFDHEADQFERRRRYRDVHRSPAATGMVSSSSPRSSCGGERAWRSESFSRREFPRGFRSERDRSRRDGGGGWCRSTEDVAALGRSRIVGSEDRGKFRSKGGSPGTSGEMRKASGVRRETSGGRGKGECGAGANEVEEGELVPFMAVEESKKETNACFEGSLKSSDRVKSGEKEDGSERKVSDSRSNQTTYPQEMLGPSSREGLQLTPEEEATTVSEGREEKRGAEEKHHQYSPPQNEESRAVHQEGQDFCSASPKDKLLDEQDDASASIPKLPSLAENAEGALNMHVDNALQLRTEIEHESCSRDVVGELREGNAEMEVEHKDKKGEIDLEVEAVETTSVVLGAGDESYVAEGNMDVTLEFMTKPLTENGRDKGKRLVISLSNDANSIDEDDDSEGPSSRGFELVFRSSVSVQDKAGTSGIIIGKNENDHHKVESLDLSLSLPGVASAHPLECSSHKPKAPSRTMSVQSLPLSLCTLSDGFIASKSMSSSQTFIHNPWGSLTQNSMENYEHSVGSRPFFQGIDWDSDGTVWRGQPSNEIKQKTVVVPSYEKTLSKDNAINQSLNTLTEQPYSNSNVMHYQSDPLRQSCTNQINVSLAARSESDMNEKILTRERGSNSLFKSEQCEKQFSFGNNGCNVDTVLAKIVSEPAHIIRKTFEDMTEQSVSYLKKTLVDIFANEDRQVYLQQFQELLLRRSDLTPETLLKCSRVLLELLVSLKTGLSDYLWRANDVPSPDLIEIFLNRRCRNLSCRSILPVDECDCKVCSQNTEFCSTCMCLVCSKFDFAFNTCSWVGCDVCLHWCHTDCALHGSHIRNGPSDRGLEGATEVQFHCVACGHPSDMLGFVKDVFKSCAKDWSAETLSKELEYVRRIFFASNDKLGKRLHDVAHQLLLKLENRCNLPEVTTFIMEFLGEIHSNMGSTPSTNEILMRKIQGNNHIVVRNSDAVVTGKETWLPSLSMEKSHHLESMSSVLPRLHCATLSRQTGADKSRSSLENVPALDGLDSVMKFKLAEAKMYQARADDAKREAESLKCIILAKKEKIEEEYAIRVSKLCLIESEERRRRKYEEFRSLEHTQREYVSMKLRMESDIKDLMLKMDATKSNLNA